MHGLCKNAFIRVPQFCYKFCDIYKFLYLSSRLVTVTLSVAIQVSSVEVYATVSRGGAGEEAAEDHEPVAEVVTFIATTLQCTRCT